MIKEIQKYQNAVETKSAAVGALKSQMAQLNEQMANFEADIATERRHMFDMFPRERMAALKAELDKAEAEAIKARIQKAHKAIADHAQSEEYRRDFAGVKGAMAPMHPAVSELMQPFPNGLGPLTVITYLKLHATAAEREKAAFMVSGNHSFKMDDAWMVQRLGLELEFTDEQLRKASELDELERTLDDLSDIATEIAKAEAHARKQAAINEQEKFIAQLTHTKDAREVFGTGEEKTLTLLNMTENDIYWHGNSIPAFGRVVVSDREFIRYWNSMSGAYGSVYERMAEHMQDGNVVQCLDSGKLRYVLRNRAHLLPMNGMYDFGPNQ